MTVDIFLLDLDGVLIKPRGYRAAVRASMDYLLDRMALDLKPPEDEVPALLEAQGVSSEWDMISILLGLLLNALANHTGYALPDLPLDEILDWITRQDTRGFSFDYAAAVRALAGTIAPGSQPMVTMRTALEDNACPALFSHLDHQLFVRDLFDPARDPYNSMQTRLVQNYVLGHRVFEQTYGLPALDESSSMLSDLDMPALEPELSAELLFRWQQQKLYLSAFTARPSLPPRDAGEPPSGYSPEAEMALRLVGLEQIPIIGYGRLQWLAGQVGGYADEYLKPAAEQPLSAAYAAITAREADGLLWAYRAARMVGGTFAHPFPPGLRLHIFEDSPIGLIGGQSAAQTLSKLGIQIELFRWGITTIPEKEAALTAAGADRIFPDVNAAMCLVLDMLDR